MRDHRMPAATRQRGMSLAVGLIMLIVLTLLVVSAMLAGKTSLKVAGNQQAGDEAAAAARQAIESVVNSPTSFYTPVAKAYQIDINSDGVVDYTVQVDAPSCLQMVAADGYSADFAASAPQDTYWDIKAVTTDNRTGSSVVSHQGVRVRMDSTATCP